MRFAPRVVCALMLSLAFVGGPTTGMVMTGAHSSDSVAVCSADAASATVGETVTFVAWNLSGGRTRVELISATNGSFYHAWPIGNTSSYSFQWTFDSAGVYAAVFSKDSQSGIFRMKCDVYVEIT